MQRHILKSGRWIAPLFLVLFVLALAAPAFALDPPWNAEPISHGLGPTYGEEWPAGSLTGEAVASRQGAPLALMPWAAVPTLLAQFQAEAAAAGVPARMTYEVVGQSFQGRDMYEVVINALETPEQVRDYQRWKTLRSMMLTDPLGAQALLASWGSDVKMCTVQAHIHGGEFEAVDANMQIIRDLTVTPRGQNPVVDKILDNEIVVVLVDANPDGRVNGTRGNPTGLDPNRDFLVQSQLEQQAYTGLTNKWLPDTFIEGHGYVNPTLIDGCTIPHNPGMEEDLFMHWNVQRIEQNRSDFAATGVPGLAKIVSPIRDWNELGTTTTRNYTVAAATQTGNTVTITTTAATLLAKQYMVVISGVPEAGYNGTFMIDEVLSPTQFTYTNPTSGLADSAGGNVALPPQPNLAQTWDDFPPYYSQSYAVLLGGPDGSTVEMTSTYGRLVSKQAQYICFYSSNNYWSDHKAEMMRDHLKCFVRGYMALLPIPDAFDSDPVLSSRFFSDLWQNYSVLMTYPMAYVIPWGGGQRSDIEANNLVRWLLHNNIQVRRATSDFTWGGTTYRASSYVVWMNQPLRGMAWNALSAGLDVSGTNIRTLYSTPGAWSLALCWSADVVEVPRDDTTFMPSTEPVAAPNALDGGVRDGVGAPSDWYCVALKGLREYPAVRALLKSGIRAQMAEAPFESTTGGSMPAGTLIFPAGAKAELDAAGKSAGIWFERNVGVAMPPATSVARVPKIAYLVTAVPAQSESTFVLDYLFSYDDSGKQQPISRLVTESDWGFVATQDSTGPKGLNNPDISDPLADYDVIFTTLTAWPSASYPLARERLANFFARGGGFMSHNVASAGFLTGAPTPLVTGTLTRTSSTAYGGIAMLDNVGSMTSPLTGPLPGREPFFLPSTVYWYSTLPDGAVVDERYPSSIATIGPEHGFIAGLWNNRPAGVNNGPVLIHGSTTQGGRYMYYNTNAFSRATAQRGWLNFIQTALWSNLTDEVTLDEGPASQTVQYSDAIEAVTFSAHDANAPGEAMTATVTSGSLPDGVSLTQIQNNGSTTPGFASWTISGEVTGPAGDYPVTVTVSDGGTRDVGALDLTFTVKQEDGFLLYNGSTAIPIKTKPTLGVQFWDSAAPGFPGLNPEPGGTVGDITKAWVRFDVRDATDTPVGSPMFGQITDTGAAGDGIGSYSVTLPQTSTEETVWLVTSTLVADGSGAMPNLFYDAPVDDTGVIAFCENTGQFALGAGKIPDGADKARFGFVARNDRKNKPKGQLVYVYDGTYNGKKAVFTIRSTGLTGVAFTGSSYPISATISGKASIRVMESPTRKSGFFWWLKKPLFSATNWRFTAKVTDTAAKPSKGSDSFAISIWTAKNELYKNVPATPLSSGMITIVNPRGS